jgi:Ca-activated chloride channel homolog
VIGDPAAARLLRAQGLAVREVPPSAVRAPLDPAALVIRSAASDFSPAQQKLLAQYVTEGGGLLLTGGPKSFGLGGWYRSPLEAVLPVTSDLRTRVDVPLVAMVMVIDRSLDGGQRWWR